MREKFRIKEEQLYNQCPESIFSFNTTKELDELSGIIGQERAEKALDFGLRVKRPGYNIFISGLTGTGRNSYSESLIKKIAADRPIPYDWCYVYNFDAPDKPQAIKMPSGIGCKFYHDMENFREQIKERIPKAFTGENYDKVRANIIQIFQEQSNELMEELNEESVEEGFLFRKGQNGFMVIPLKDGKPMTDEELDELTREQIKELEDKSSNLQLKALSVIRQIRELEKKAQKKLEEIDQEVGFSAVEFLINELEVKYKDYSEIYKFILKVKENLKSSIKEFKTGPKDEDDEDDIPLSKLSHTNDVTFKYKVNLFIDSSKLTGAPVISEINPTYYNLFGRIEYESKMGVLTTDFTKIKAGDLHRANGGYLIIQASDVLGSMITWNGLKRALKKSLLTMESINEQQGLVATSSLRPQPIPLDVKVIMIGSYHIYSLLYNLDEDFRKLFKVKAEFDTEMDRSNEHINRMANFIGSHCKREGLPHFDRSGVAKIIEYSSRVADNQEKLSTRFNEIVEIIHEAAIWAQFDGSHEVTRKHVEKAMEEKIYRSNSYQKKSYELIEKGTILMDVEGKVVGQVNGLSVLDTGDYSFGKPSRITATTYAGKKGIINIEREINLSGNIHDKGVLILNGYLGAKFAQNFPLSLSASICFEQSYGGVDGDSASSTELYALLSSLSDIPIEQGIAVTGSVNQRGEIQPIGGVNEKIEGFFDICSQKGLTGNQGVMIPHQNVVNLMLKDEVVRAVRECQFHIYAIKTIEEGIEILTGVEAGIPEQAGKYPDYSVYGKVYNKLRNYAEIVGRE